jgi:uncharacterized protein YebE (UPF0316 family)
MLLLMGATFPFPPTLPLLVFAAEMCVVTLGTIRIIFIARGMKALAPLLGFFEVSIWLFAIGQIMQNLDNVGCYLAFAAGFTGGNYLGILLEKKLALGNVVIHTITKRDAGGLIEGLRVAGYGVTRMDGRGATGPVQIVFTVIKRKELAKVTALIEQFDPKAFYSIHDLQSAAEGIFPAARERPRGVVPAPLWLFRLAALPRRRPVGETQT